jgi:hypothetical protein
MFCYVIQGENGGPIKIGKAVNVRSRVAGIQVGYPYTLIVRATLSEGEETERHAHQLFRQWRLRGEWFDERAAPEISDWISANPLLRSGGAWTTTDYTVLHPTEAEVRQRMRAALIDHAPQVLVDLIGQGETKDLKSILKGSGRKVSFWPDNA